MRCKRCGFWVMFVGLLFVPVTLVYAANDVPLVLNGNPAVVIATGQKPTAMVQEAARLLVRIIEKSSGARLVVSTKVPASGNVLHLRIATAEEPLDADGFVIDSPSDNEIRITGGSGYGLVFGVQDLLERYLGVRWLLPGDIGEVVPHHATIRIPRNPVHEHPAFFSRQLSGLTFGGSRRDNALAMFLFRQRMHGRIHFHHNLLHLYPPSKYTKTHPNFFPMIKGKRFLPKTDSESTWQPDLHAEGIVTEGIRNIDAYFDAHPEAESYSLGMNDSHAWDESLTQGDVPRNSVGMVDLSDYYFTWANLVVAGVLKKHPGKWFGCLAFNELTDPPSSDIGINRRILPYICIDRMVWADAKLRAKDIARTEAWEKAAGSFAWYDYVYGDQFYKVPRIYFHLMGEYLRFAHEHGVKAYYAEAYPTAKWTEGPKLYILLRLLWNPDQDVDTMLNEWCRLAVGEKAAPSLRAYYDFWERYWTQRVPRTEWFKAAARRQVYLPYNQGGYLDALRVGDIDICAGYMDKMLASAGTIEEKARAQFLYNGWLTVRKAMQQAMMDGLGKEFLHQK